MSHFSVLVITKEKPTQELLEKTLQPWHEYECTGVKDEYVVEVDVTDQMKADYEEYCEDKTNTLSEFATWRGADERDGRFYRTTNPNSKWDWWQVGGRATGILVPDYDPSKDPANEETCPLCRGSGKRLDRECKNGCNGCDGKGTRNKWSSEWVKIRGDQIQVKDIPFNVLRAEKEMLAAEDYDQAHAIINGRTFYSFGECRQKFPDDVDAARKFYWGQDVIQELNSKNPFFEIEQYKKSRDQFITEAGLRAGVTYALVHDGNWYERGKMGWWGMATDEKERDVWHEEYHKLLQSIDPEMWVSVVDCHI